MSDLVNQLSNGGNIPTIQTESTKNMPTRMPIGGGAVSTGSVKTKRSKGISRQPIDLSSLPKKEEPDIKESIQSEIFKPGGDFDQMIERRHKEMEEAMNDPKFIAQAEEALRRMEEEKNRGSNLSSTSSIIEDTSDDDFFDDGYDEDFDTSSATTVDMDEDFGEYELNTDEEDGVEDDIPVDMEPEEKVEEPVDMKGTGIKLPHPIYKESEKVETPNVEEKVVDDSDQIEDVELDDMGTVEEEEKSEEPKKSQEEEDAEEEARVKYLKEEITKKLKPVSKRVNIQGFPVAKKGTKSKNVPKKSFHLAKWPLINTGIVATFKEIPGSIVELLREHINRNDARAALHILYEHIASAKPQNFDSWCKTIDAADYDHLFMGYYIASFQGANYIPMDCTNPDCPRKVFITDDMPFIKMVKFNSKENKSLFNKIYKEEPERPSDTTVAYRIPLSESLAVDIRRSTLYSEYVETSYLTDRFIESYADVIGYIRNIDAMYHIDIHNNTLIPVDYEEIPDNPGKTTANKIRAYAKEIRTLSVDEAAVLRAYIAELDEKTINITYQRPEATCTICGAKVAATDMTAGSLVFLRNQLGLLTITSES